MARGKDACQCRVTLEELATAMGVTPSQAANAAGEHAQPDWRGRLSVPVTVAAQLVREQEDRRARVQEEMRAQREAQEDYYARRRAYAEAAYRKAANRVQAMLVGRESPMMDANSRMVLMQSYAPEARDAGNRAYRAALEEFDSKGGKVKVPA